MKNDYMYKTIEDLILMMERRGLAIDDPYYAKSFLSKVPYFILCGYEDLFLNRNGRFKRNATFKEIVCLYNFDKNIKMILLKVLLEIEQKFKSSMAEVITSQYGDDHHEYLNIYNYNINHPKLEHNLKRVREQKKTFGSKNKLIRYHINNQGYVPFWALSKILTMGVVKNLFDVMKSTDREHVARMVYSRLPERNIVRRMSNLMALLVDLRNMCAHHDIVFNFRHNRVDIGILPEHKHFKLYRSSKGSIISGRKDLFAAFIAIKYLIDEDEFSRLIILFNSEIDILMGKIHSFNRNNLLGYMGLPVDFYKLKDI